MLDVCHEQKAPDNTEGFIEDEILDSIPAIPLFGHMSLAKDGVHLILKTF